MTTMLRLPQVMAHVGFSRSMVYALIKRGDFLPPVKLTAQSSGWQQYSGDIVLISVICQAEK